MLSTKWRILAGGLAALLIAIAAAIVLSSWSSSTSKANSYGHAVLPSAEPRAGALPLSFPAPKFDALPDQDDKPMSTATLAGKVWIVDFIFTHCGSVCPKMTSRRVELLKQISDPRVMFLSISVDPERDDRGTRKTYAADNKMDEGRWKFIRPATKEAALQLAAGMKIVALPPPRPGNAKPYLEDHPILHSDRFVLIDAHSKVRGTYAMDDESAMQRLVRDATALAAEAAPLADAAR
jgi:protein SCO1/2